MPIRKWSRSYLARLATQGYGPVTKLIGLGGFRFGSTDDIPGATGISSRAPRTERKDVLQSASVLDWRGMTMGSAQIGKMGNITTNTDRGQELAFDWNPTSDKTEDLVGLVSKHDIICAEVLTDIPSIAESGMLADSAWFSSATGNPGLSQIYNFGSSLNGTTWAFSVWVAPVDPTDTANKSILLCLGDDALASVTATLITYTGSGKWQRLWINKTFAVATTKVQVRVAPITADGSGAMLIGAAQLDQATYPSAYERTNWANAGARNRLRGSHFPGRTESGAALALNVTTTSIWFLSKPSGVTYDVSPCVGRGPDGRGFAPTAGTVEFSIGKTGPTFPDDQVLFTPTVDASATKADRLRVSAGGAATLYMAQTFLIAPQSKTLVASIWVRRRPETGTAPAANWGLNFNFSSAGGYVWNQNQLFASTLITQAWRRIWVRVYHPPTGTGSGGRLYADVDRCSMDVYIPGTNVTGNAIEVWGAQMQSFAGDVDVPPSDYQQTVGAAAGVNLILWSEDFSNGAWSKDPGLTIDSNFSEPPMQWYEVRSPSYGASGNLARLNRIKDTYYAAGGFDFQPSTAVPRTDVLRGSLFSVGGFGGEQLGIVGDLSSANEMLGNTSFENTLVAPWVLNAPGAAGSHSLDLTQGNFNTGKTSAKMNRAAAGAIYMYQPSRGFQAGKWYLYQAQVKSDSACNVNLNVNNPADLFYQNGSDTWAGSNSALSPVTPGTSFQTISKWILIDAAAARPWLASTAYGLDTIVTNGGNSYKCIIAGTSAAAGGPTGNQDFIIDNAARWKFLAPYVLTDYLQFWLSHNSTNGSVWWDDVSVMGPYDTASQSEPCISGWALTTQEQRITGETGCETFTGWTPGAGVTLDAVAPHAGTNSWKYTHPGGTVYVNCEQGIDKLQPAMWYQLTLWVKGTVKTNGLRLRFVNLTRTRQWQTGVGWVAGNSSTVNAYLGNVTASWVQHTLWIQSEATSSADDNYAPVIEMAGNVGYSVGNTMNVDDVSLLGPFNSQSTSDPGHVIAPVTAAPNVWADDEDQFANGVVSKSSPSLAAPSYYLTTIAATALGADWYTVRARIRGCNTTNQVRLAVKRAADNFYMTASQISFRDTTLRWIHPHVKEAGFYSPDWGVAVWHIFIPSAGSYYFSIGGYSSESSIDTNRIWIDSVRVWSAAGQIFSAPDDGSTLGESGYRSQGLNTAFRGLIDDTISADDTKLSIRARDYIHGTGLELPLITTQPNCQAKFRGSVCGYTQTTTIATPEVVATTVHTTVANGTSKLRVGQYVESSSGLTSTKITVINATNQFTTQDAQTYALNQPIILSNCKKTYVDCDLRQRTHRYLGFRATKGYEATLGTPYWRTVRIKDMGVVDLPSVRKVADSALIGAINMSAQESLGEKNIFDDSVVPLVFGRKSVKLLPIETHFTKHAVDSSEWLTTFYAISAGPIEEIRAFFTAEGFFNHSPESGVMVFWRRGTVGEDYWWTENDQFSGTTEDTQLIPNQMRDFRTNTDCAYTGLAYAIVQIRKGNPLVDSQDPTKMIPLWADIKGIRCQIYDRLGRPVGAPAWTRNPIWIACWLMMDRTYGAGLRPETIDWETMSESAEHCDEPINITEADAVITENPITAAKGHQVNTVAGFSPEMPVVIKYGGSTANRTVKWIDPINQRLFFDSAYSAAGTTYAHVVTGWPARYTCDLVYSKKNDFRKTLDLVMNSCRGFLTFDGGRIGIAIEKSRLSVFGKTWQVGTPTPADALGVIPGSVKFDQRQSQSYNALEASYECSELLAGTIRTAKYADADRGGLDFPKILKLEASGCDTNDQAIRAMLPRFIKACAVAGGSEDTSQDVRGLSIEGGPSMRRIQCGDFIQVTRTGRTTSQKSRVRQVVLHEDGKVGIQTIPEAGLIRAEGFGPMSDPYSDYPGTAASTPSPLNLTQLGFAIAQYSAGKLEIVVTSTGYSIGPGTGAGTLLRKLVAIELHASLLTGFVPTTGSIGLGGTLVAYIDPLVGSLTWSVPVALLDIPMFLRIVGRQGGTYDLETPVISAEIPVTVYRTDRPASDPTQQEGSDPTNMVYGGDFEPSLVVPWSSTQGTASYPTDGSNLIYPGTIVNNFANNTGGYYTNAPLLAALPWAASSAYKIGDCCYNGLNSYTCSVAGTSGAASAPTGGGTGIVDGTGTLRWDYKGPWPANAADIAADRLLVSDSLPLATYDRGVHSFKSFETSDNHTTNGSICYKNFVGASGSGRCRPYFRLRSAQFQSKPLGGRFLLQYWINNGVSVFSVVQDPTPSPAGTEIEYYGPEINGQLQSQLWLSAAIIKNRSISQTGPYGSGQPDACWEGHICRVGLQIPNALPYGGSVSGNKGAIWSDGVAGHWGNLYRPFPGKSPVANQVVFNAGTLNLCRVQLHAGITPNAPVQVRIYDTNNSNKSWVIAEIPAASIPVGVDGGGLDIWMDFATKFSISEQVSGQNLQIEVRTMASNTIVYCDKLLISRGDTIFAWSASHENKSEGYFGDFSGGEPVGFSKGGWGNNTIDGTVTRSQHKSSLVQ